ncbi:hypothetical protein M378DRAFT_164280, partial [Amanita muscaria Koide BX008]
HRILIRLQNTQKRTSAAPPKTVSTLIHTLALPLNLYSSKIKHFPMPKYDADAPSSSIRRHWALPPSLYRKSDIHSAFPPSSSLDPLLTQGWTQNRTYRGAGPAGEVREIATQRKGVAQGGSDRTGSVIRAL